MMEATSIWPPRFRDNWTALFWFWIILGVLFPLGARDPQLYVLVAPALLLLMGIRAAVGPKLTMPLGDIELRTSWLLGLFASVFMGLMLLGYAVATLAERLS